MTAKPEVRSTQDAPPPTGTGVATTEKFTFKSLMESIKPDVAKILPKYLTPERMMTLVQLAATKTPELKQCTPQSLVMAVINAARVGLEVGTHAHLVPFNNSKTGKKECVMIPDYRGLISLAVRSEKVKHIDARVVYKDDAFDYQLGTDGWIKHKPKLGGDRKEFDIIAFYCVARLADDTMVFDEPMSKAEVDAVRERSRAKSNGPWVTDYVMMGRKTAVKRFCKYLPQTPELTAAIELDTRAETGERSTVNALIDTEEEINNDIATGAKDTAEALKAKIDAKKKGAAPAAASTAPQQSGDDKAGSEDARTPLTSASAAEQPPPPPEPTSDTPSKPKTVRHNPTALCKEDDWHPRSECGMEKQAEA